jgi:hypothetical protein
MAEWSRLSHRASLAGRNPGLACHPGAVPTGPLRLSTCSARTSTAWGMASVTFVNYRLRLLLHCGVRWQTHRPRGCEVAPHVSWRRARYVWLVG